MYERDTGHSKNVDFFFIFTYGGNDTKPWLLPKDLAESGHVFN